jgi:hypothetical protein
MPGPLRAKFRTLLTLAATAILMLPAGTAAAQKTVPAFFAEGLGRAAVAMDGEWKFQAGDNLAWAAPEFDDSQWTPIKTGRPWEGQGYRDHTGFGWYRRQIVLPSNLSAGWDLALALTNVEDAAEVYWNGRRVGSFGRVPPDPIWYGDVAQTRTAVVVLGAAVDQPRQGVLAIRVWKAPYAYLSSPDMGGLTATPVLGSAGALEAIRTAARFDWLRGHLYTFAIALLSCLASILALVAWMRDRRRWLLFWLAAYTLRPVALLFAEQLPGTTWRISYGSAGMVYSATDAALWFLLLYLLNLRENSRVVEWTRVCACITVGTQILEGAEQLFDWTRAPHFFLLADVGLTIPSLLLQAWPLVLIVLALRKPLDASRWMVAASGMLADGIANADSWFDLGNRWTHWTIAAKIEAPLFTIAGNSFDGQTIADTLLLLSIVYAVWRYEQEQSRQQMRLNEEFRNAQELQQLLIPEHLPSVPGMVITSAYRPAQEVGGDFFQLIPLEGDSALVILGDVSGKGLHAAMTVALIVGALRSIVETTSDPPQVLAALNRRLYGRLRHGFATCLVLRLDGDGECAVANAGHLPPYVNGDELQVPNALPLGLLAEAEYELRRFRMAPADRLTLYTDGLLEARNSAGELFGFSRIADLLGQAANARDIADVAQQFGQEDDITVLTLRMEPATVPA